MTREDAGLLTVTVKAQLPVSPFSLLAEQLTVVTPAGKVEPEGGEQVMTAPSKVSLTVGEGYSTTARHLPASAFLMMLPGQMIAGGASETMTEAVAVLLAELSSGAGRTDGGRVGDERAVWQRRFHSGHKRYRRRSACGQDGKRDAAVIAEAETNSTACRRTGDERYRVGQGIGYREIGDWRLAVIGGRYLISEGVAGFDNARRGGLADSQVKARQVRGALREFRGVARRVGGSHRHWEAELAWEGETDDGVAAGIGLDGSRADQLLALAEAGNVAVRVGEKLEGESSNGRAVEGSLNDRCYQEKRRRKTIGGSFGGY